ncbi:hypothetical protein A2U01_0032600, partial [Trifolium medium]|nr:hypothetical protein [Trifolium medium]
MLFSAFRSAK